MEAWLQDVFRWLPDGWVYYAILGLIALLESVVGIGLLVPGSVITVFAGFLAFHGKGEFVWVAGAAAAGGLAGDLLSFWLGGHLGFTLFRHPLLRRRADLLQRARLFFADHGGKSVFFGRFLGPLRGFIPFVAGGAHMRTGYFFLYTLVSACLWGMAYPGLGYLGGASWQKVRFWTGRFGVLMTILLVLVVLNTLFWKKVAPPLAAWLAARWRALNRRWQAVLASRPVQSFAGRHPDLWSLAVGRFSLQRGSGLYLTVGFAVSIFFAALFLWLAGGLPLLERLDLQVNSALSHIRHPHADAFMLGVAVLADGTTLLLLSAYMLFWLVLHNRDFSALILVVGLSGGELLLYLLHLFFRRPPPLPLLPDLPASFTGFPSGHAFTVALFCGLVVYFIVGTFSLWQTRLTVVIAGSSIALLVGFSRVYLGLQWLTSVLAGFALAALWLTFLITAAELRRRYAGEFPWRTGWQPVRLSAGKRRFLLAAGGLAVFAAILVHLVTQMGYL